MQLVDSHCHLDAAEFEPDRDRVVARAREAGVQWQVVPATTAAGWPGLRAACRAGAGLFPAYGLHPMFLDRHRPQHLDTLREWLQRERPVAVGECGLDHFVPGLDPRQQMDYFRQQLALARDHDLPVIVHARRAVDQVTAAIRRIGGLRGVVHSFSGSRQQADQLIKQGFLLGIGGPVSHPRAARLRALVAALPVDALLLETDSPDQPDAGIRGQRNEPARLPVILDVVARLRAEEPASLAAATTANAARLFRLPLAATAPRPGA